MSPQELLIKLIENEFSLFRTPESLILSLNTMKLMMALVAEDSQVPILLVDGAFEKTLVKKTSVSTNYQEILILRALNGGIPHYFTLYIENNDGLSRCILLDASNCTEHFVSIMEKLSTCFDKVLIAVGDNTLRKLQNDTKSCMLFAFDHALSFQTSLNTQRSPLLAIEGTTFSREMKVFP